VDGSYGDAVRADEDEARALGMTEVPFYAVDGNHGISGARPDEAFTQALRQVRASRAVRPLFRGDYPRRRPPRAPWRRAMPPFGYRLRRCVVHAMVGP
jgi:hypothetical protein